jgi:DNA invertase Pin-like site-specific DNA recombinase
MLKYFMYCRKSSEDEDRQMLSNESQKENLEPVAKRDGLFIQDRLQEAASAKEADTRDVFNEMVKRIKSGEATAILCWHPNRLSRNAVDAAKLVDLMDHNKLVEIRTPSQTFRNTPGDKFLLTLFCSQAKLENDNKGVDVKRGLQTKVKMGWRPGQANYGYLNDKTKERGQREIINDPRLFPIVKRIWGLILTGAYTPPQILDIANSQLGFRTRVTKKQGGKPLTRSGLYKLFHSHFYYGWFEYPVGSGNWHQGKHEPMITKAQFDWVQAFLRRAGYTRPIKNRTFAFTGLIRCGECAAMITAEEKHRLRCTNCGLKFSYPNREQCPRCETLISKMEKPRFCDYTYYHCTKRTGAICKQPSVNVAELEQKIGERLDRIHVSSEFKEWAFKYIEVIHEMEMNSAKQSARSRQKVTTDYEKRLDALIRLKTSPENSDGSLISDQEYSKQRQQILAEKADMKSPAELKTEAERAFKATKEAFEFASSVRKKFIEGDYLTKKRILATVGSKPILKDKNLMFEAISPYVLFEKFNSDENGKTCRFETQNNALKQGWNKQSDDKNVTLLRERNSVRTSDQKLRKLVGSIYHYFRDTEVFSPHIWN